MSARKTLRRWHLWLGWLLGVPFLIWTLSGLAMVLKPIEEVRGEHLRIEQSSALPSGNPAPIAVPIGDKSVRSLVTSMQSGRAITRLTRVDGSIERYDASTGQLLDPLTEGDARALLASSIVGGYDVKSLILFEADESPRDLRRPVAAWQATLADETHVYVGRDSGEIEAVRTRWWRIYDFFWGLHIMDLETREDSHNPWLVIFTGFSLLTTLLALVLLPLSSRRRRR